MKPLYTILLLTGLYAALAIFTYTTHARAEVTVAPAPVPAPATPSASQPTDAPASEVPTIRKELEKEKQRTLTKLVGAQAIFDATSKQFAQLSDDLDKEIASDDSLLGLKQACDLRQTRLAHLQLNRNGSQDEIDQTLVSIDGLHLDISTRIDSIRLHSHGGIYYELAKAKLNASLTLLQAQTQLQNIETRLSQYQ